MSLDRRPTVKLTGDSVRRYLDALNDRALTYDFVALGAPGDTVVLQLEVEGSDDHNALLVTLNPDGTWTSTMRLLTTPPEAA
jgi:hypothetical protein